MSDELHALLARASNDIEGAAPGLDGGRLGLVRSAARRRRIARRTAESFAGVGVVGVLGVGLWLGLGQQTPEPVVPVVTPTVTPTPTPTPSPTVTPTPSATPTGPVVREESIDDATVLDRLEHPRTGEVWQTPTPAPDMAPVLLLDSSNTVFLVGSRGPASIYVAVAADFYGMGASVDLFEVDAAGPRRVACPSARTGDACADEPAIGPDGLVAGLYRWDTETFYDTLTLPREVDLGGDFVLTTTRTQQSSYFPYWVFGDGGTLVDAERGDQRVLRRLGPLAVVAETSPSEVPGLTNLDYAITTPFGTTITLTEHDVPGGDFDAIRWQPGFEPTPSDDGGPLVAASPGEGACFGRTFSQETTHVAAQWRRAGETAEGRPVFVPVEGGNAMSQAVRAWQEEISWTVGAEGADGLVEGAEAGYRYPTDAGFLAANALYAFQGPAGEWFLALRSDAVQAVWECV